MSIVASGLLRLRTPQMLLAANRAQGQFEGCAGFLLPESFVVQCASRLNIACDARMFRMPQCSFSPNSFCHRPFLTPACPDAPTS